MADGAAIEIEVDLPEGGALAGMAEVVREGLSCPFKELPPKYFYDERGSELFERITEQPEYYPTRCERAILDARAAEIVAAAMPRTLIELGSGAASKSRVLLDAMRGRRDAREVRPGRHLRGDHPPRRRRARRRVPGARGRGDRLRLRDPPRAHPAAGGRAVRVPRRHDRQLPAGAAALLPGPHRHADVSRGPLPARHRPRQGPRDARGRLQRRGGSHLRVQQERPQRPQPRARRRLRPRRLRARRLLGRGQRMDRHPPAGALGAVRRPPRARHAGPLLAQRGDANGDLDQVHPRADRIELRRRRPRAASSGGPTRRGSTRSASPAPL